VGVVVAAGYGVTVFGDAHEFAEEAPCRWLQTRKSSSLINFKNVAGKFLNCPRDYKGSW
jgi:hypothetical protein